MPPVCCPWWARSTCSKPSSVLHCVPARTENPLVLSRRRLSSLQGFLQSSSQAAWVPTLDPSASEVKCRSILLQDPVPAMLPLPSAHAICPFLCVVLLIRRSWYTYYIDAHALVYCKLVHRRTPSKLSVQQPQHVSMHVGRMPDVFIPRLFCSFLEERTFERFRIVTRYDTVSYGPNENSITGGTYRHFRPLVQ